MAKKKETETAKPPAENSDVAPEKTAAKRTRSPKELFDEAKTVVEQKQQTAKKTAPRKPKTKPKKTAPKPRKSAQKKKENPHVTRPTADEEAKILSRRNLVFELKKSGASFRQISEHLKARGIEGASVGQVHADWQFMLNDASENLALSVEHHIEAEIAVLDEIQFSFYQDIKRESNLDLQDRRDAAAVILQCIEKRAKLRNLYKPVKVQIDADEELAKLLGISKEELPPLEQPPQN